MVNREKASPYSPFSIHHSLLEFIDRAAAGLRAAGAALGVRVERRDVVHGDLFAGAYVAQGVELDVAVEDFHVGVGRARVVDVVCAVAAAAAVDAPLLVEGADAEHPAVGPPVRLGVRDALARVVRDLFASREAGGGEAPTAVDARFFDGESGRELHSHDGTKLT